MTHRILTIIFIVCAICLAGCDWMPGKPKSSSKWQPASSIADFQILYNQNCLACHGNDETVAGSIAMDNPTYLALIPRDVLQKVIANGVPHTAMPGFSEAVGGALTDAQIGILVNGILSHKPPQIETLPPYRAALGLSSRGAQVFSASCASCHGSDGSGGKAGSVIDSDYLDLVSDQYLRAIVIAGRPDLGCPDIFTRTPGHPLSNEDVSNVTAWLASHRKNEFGQPLIISPP